MARPRTPLQSLTPGTISNQASRIVNRAREPKTAGKLGLASQWLSAEQKTIWKRLVKFTPAVLGESDRTLLEIATVLKSKLEAGTIENAQIAQLLSVLSKLGMVPKERTSSQSDDEKEKSEWDDL
jgi:phage terminase small subunit